MFDQKRRHPPPWGIGIGRNHKPFDLLQTDEIVLDEFEFAAVFGGIVHVLRIETFRESHGLVKGR